MYDRSNEMWAAKVFLPIFSGIALLWLCGAWFPPAAYAAESTRWGPVFELESRLNADRGILSPKLLVPIAQDNTSLLFADIRMRIDDNSSEEYNLGLGYRRMYGAWILGGYGFIDHLRSSNGFGYWQMTAGLEALSSVVDGRINFYAPESSENILGGAVAVDQFNGNLGIAGGTWERALPGVDAEVGFKLPFDPLDLTLFGGAYYFDAPDFERVAGPKARVEMSFDDRLIPSLPSGAEITFGIQYQNDGPREGTTSALAEIRLPFGGGTPARQAGLARRMTDFIERDIDIITAQQDLDDFVPARTQINGKTYSKVSTIPSNDIDPNLSLSLVGQDALILLDGGVFVNTRLEPLDGQALIGGGSSITVRGGGRTVTGALPGTRPTVYAIDVDGISDVTFRGFDIDNSAVLAGFPALAINGGANYLIDDINATGPNNSFGIHIANASNITFINSTASRNIGPTPVLRLETVTGMVIDNVSLSGARGIQMTNSVDVSGTVDATATVAPCFGAAGNAPDAVINFVGGGTCP